MALARILTDKMRPIVTSIRVVMSHSCLYFLYDFTSISAYQDLEIGSGFGDSRHMFEALVVFLGDQCGCGLGG